MINETLSFKLYIFSWNRRSWIRGGGAPEPGGGPALLRLLQEPVPARLCPTRSAGAGHPRCLVQSET